MNRASLRLSFVLLLPVLLSAQGIFLRPLVNHVSFVVPLRDTTIVLPHRFIVRGTDRVVADSTAVLLRGRDYVIDESFGLLSLIGASLCETVHDTAGRRTMILLHVEYEAYPLEFKQTYRLREVSVRTDTATHHITRIVQPVGRPFTEDLFGPGLQKSGSLVRGFTVATNRDLTLNSGFRLQLAGRLSDDVDVVAALTDENTPIQPEGTTQALREVDKVFVEIRNPRFGATLGDFNLEVTQKEGGEFGSVNRKLQGGIGTARFGRATDASASVSVVGASARGKFQTNQFSGADGVQGPYRLSGRNGEQRLVVIAGSERVYLNGELMTRGEANDYVIDYGGGEVTFASKRLITNASRITVDFEYSDQAYTRNFFGAAAEGTILSGRASLRASFYQEADDPESPLETPLSDQDRAILRQSGADRLRASQPGIRYAGRDSLTGRALGTYLIRDTVISVRTLSIVVYAPGDSLALYNVFFSPVDRVPADSAGYVRVGVGQYGFAGLGVGTHVPLQLLPMPQRHQVVDINTNVALADGLHIRGEYAASRFDPNRFSPDVSTQDAAYSIGLTYSPRDVRAGGLALGDMDFKIRQRHVGGGFVALDRSEAVEFDRDWNLERARTSDETLQETEFRWSPNRALTGVLQFGSLDRTGQVHSSRWQGEAAVRDSLLPRMSYRIEQITSEDDVLALRSSWTRQVGRADYSVGAFQPGLRVETEDRSRRPSATDSLLAGGFRFLEVAPRIGLERLGPVSLTGEWQFRTEDSVAAGARKRASAALTQLYTGSYQPSSSFGTQLTLSLRQVQYTEEFRLRGNSDADVLLVRSQTRLAPFQRAVESDLYYEFSNQRSSRLERVFLQVSPGTGNYRYLGDKNGNGIADENEFEPTRFDGNYVALYLPGEQLVPTADLKTSVRLRLQPARLIERSGGLLNAALRSISTETYLRVDERSREPDEKQIYLLNFSRMLDSKNTISGSQQVTQDVFLFENDRDVSFRFRYGERYGLTQLVSATERSLGRERSMRLRIQLDPEIGNQTEVSSRDDRVTASVVTPRVRDIAATSITSDFSYRPDRQWEAGLVLGGGEAENRTTSGNTTASMNEQTVRCVYAFPGTGQFRAEFKREEVILRGSTLAVPYELTGGKVSGRTWLWQVWFDYRITSNLQLTMNYSGRTEGGRQPVHIARAEARAFF